MATVSFVISKAQLEYLKKLSHQLSIDRNKDTSVSDIIRESLQKTFQMSKEK